MAHEIEVSFTFKAPLSLKAQLDDLAEKNGLSVAETIRQALFEAVSQYDGCVPPPLVVRQRETLMVDRTAEKRPITGSVGAKPVAKKGTEGYKIPFRDRIGCSVEDAMIASSIGRTKFYQLINDGRIKSKMIDGRRVVSVASLQEFLDVGIDD